METPHFIVIAGVDKDKQLSIQAGAGHTMGRHENATYRINDPRCSRFHCEVQYENDQVTVIDQGGSGGIIVNGQKMPHKVLRHGDTLKVGDTVLRFQAGSSPDAETLPKVKRNAELDPKAVEELAELSGRPLARFQIGDVLGRGQSGMVFRATNTKDGKIVALKIMQRAFSQNEDEIQRFVRAMKTMMPHEHPHLVTIFGAGKTGPYCWAEMEYVEGESLTQVIQRIGTAGMLDWRYALRVGVHIGKALEYAHGEHIVHRNITPQNILVRALDKVTKLGDLMLAKAQEGSLAQQITRPGELLGDLRYMPPERTTGTAALDARSDIYALGATLYALLTGRPPNEGTTPLETVQKIRTETPVKPKKYQLSIPDLFEGTVLKMLEKRPEDRFQTATQLLQDLERVAKYQGVTV